MYGCCCPRSWYLGEVTEEVATSILRSGQRSNSFAVYSSHGVASYILSARWSHILRRYPVVWLVIMAIHLLTDSACLSLSLCPVRFRVEGVEEDLVEHLHISRTDGGCFHVQGQVRSCVTAGLDISMV